MSAPHPATRQGSPPIDLSNARPHQTTPEQTGLFPGATPHFRSNTRNKRRTGREENKPARERVSPAQAKKERQEEAHWQLVAACGYDPRYLPDPHPLEELHRHADWQRGREAVRDTMGRGGFPVKRLHRFCCCGAMARVRVSKDGQKMRVQSMKCRDRFCEPCRYETAAVIRQNLRNQLFDRRKGRTKVFRKIELTLVSTADATLAQQKRRIFHSFRLLRQRPEWKKYVVGGSAFFEVTLNKKTLLWHPHLHVIVEGDFFPVEELKALWADVTGDSSVVWIKPLTDDTHAAHEAAKYASKGFTSPEDDPSGTAANVYDHPDKLQELMISLRGLRLCTTFGEWRGWRLTAKEKPADEEWVDVGSLVEIIAKARAGDVWAQGILRGLEAQRPRYGAGRSRDRPPDG